MLHRFVRSAAVVRSLRGAALPTSMQTASVAVRCSHHHATSNSGNSHNSQQQQQQQEQGQDPSPQAAAWRKRMALLGLGSLATGGALYAASDLSSPLSLSTVSAAASRWTPSLLSHSKVYQTLSGTSPMEQITPIERGVVSSVHVNQFAANHPTIEDSVALVKSVAGAPEGGMLLGVFDGHSGSEASRWCSEELLPYLIYYNWSQRTNSLIHKRTFLDADHHFLELAIRDRRMKAGLSGACLTVAHVKGKVVRTANAGDCRTIVGKKVMVPRRTATPAKEGAEAEEGIIKYQAVELTTDHQIDTNHLERERLLREHPDEEDIIRKNRVKGRLQPTRGFGDGFYKRREFYGSRTLSRPYAVWTPPYTTVEPDITEYELSSEDEFMVMATDGLFQDLNSQQVVEYVGEWLAMHKSEQARAGKTSFFSRASPPPTYTPNASTYLIRQALTHASEHAVGRRRKENENISWILQVPQESKRNVHDDVSVVVVFFDQSANYPSDDAVGLASGPPVPPTLSRALNLHLKTPPASQHSRVVDAEQPPPIQIQPVQGLQGAEPAIVTKLRSNL